MSTAGEKLHKPKPGSSWDYMKKVKDDSEKIIIFYEDKDSKTEWWHKYSKGKE
jgi:hypothetical protein